MAADHDDGAVEERYGPLGNDDKKRFLVANVLDPEARTELKKRSPRPDGGFDVVFTHLFMNHFTRESRPRVLRALPDLCNPKGSVFFDLPLSSPSRHINGEDSDETHLGIRTLILSPVSWSDVTLSHSLPTVSFTTTISEAEVSRANGEATELVSATDGTFVRSMDSIDRRSATKDIARDIWGRGLASKERVLQHEPPVVKADLARCEWFDKAFEEEQRRPRGFGMPWPFRLSYGLHVEASNK